MELRPRNYFFVLYLIPAFAIWYLFYLPFLPYHLLHVDTVVYILGAKKIILGGVPYLDFWDHKPPLVHFLYALVLKLCGFTNYRALNYVTLGFSLVSTVFVFLIAYTITGRQRAAGLISLLYPILANIIACRDAVNPNTEIYMETCALIGLYSALQATLSGRKTAFMLSGIWIAIACAFKQPAAVSIGVVFFLQLVEFFKSKNWRQFLLSFLLFSTGFLFVWMIIVFYFYLNNALSDFLFQCSTFNAIYSSTIPAKGIIKNLTHIYLLLMQTRPLFFIPYCISLCWLLYSVTFRKIDFKKHFFFLFLLIWHLADIVGISAGGIFFLHYFVQWTPSLLLITFIPLFDCLSILPYRFRWSVWILTGFYYILVGLDVSMLKYNEFSGNPWDYSSPLYYYRASKILRDKLGSGYYSYPYYYSPKFYWEIKKLVQTIKAKTRPDQPIFVWGFMPEFYLLASREPASRFIYTSFVTGNFHALGNLFQANNSLFQAYHQDIAMKLIFDLEEKKPPVIIIDDFEKSPYSRFFWDYLERFYTPVKTDSKVLQLYLRKKNL